MRKSAGFEIDDADEEFLEIARPSLDGKRLTGREFKVYKKHYKRGLGLGLGATSLAISNHAMNVRKKQKTGLVPAAIGQVAPFVGVAAGKQIAKHKIRKMRSRR